MTIIRQALEVTPAQLKPIRLAVERLTLAKRRWRGVAEDGAEFGFDLERPIADGAAFHQTGASVYVIAQKYEPVLELRIASICPEPAGSPEPVERIEGRMGSDAARVGWLIGNLHFQIEVLDEIIRVVDDSAVRQMFEREGIMFTPCKRVFHPISGGHSHGP
jgi:urease accessory protein